MGDHICYISDLTEIKSHYPSWSLTRKIDDIIEELLESVTDLIAKAWKKAVRGGSAGPGKLRSSHQF
jgi:hypothetical protein